MPVYLAPGVYVEEVPGTPPIVGVGTSTAALIGEVAADVFMPLNPVPIQDPLYGSIQVPFQLAPVNKAVLVTNFEQFKNNFGEFQLGNQTLAHAVFGFFLNGGTRCLVIRVEELDNATLVQEALDELEKVDEIAIVAAPGALSIDVQTTIINHCVNLEDRFAIIDGQRTTTITVDAIKGTGTDILANNNYAAL